MVLTSARVVKLRQRMVDRQLKSRGIKDERVLQAFLKVPREKFIEEALSERAYEDYPLPIGEGQTISQPYIVALMTELLQIKERDRILEIGTGSGYQTAILAELGDKVFSIERISSLARKAKAALERLNYSNITLRVGDGSYGWPEFAPFDKIIVTAGTPSVPEPLLSQLKEGGRLVAPVGDTFSQVLQVVEIKEGKRFFSESCECRFVPLIGKYGWPEGNNGKS
jgi:protein-L-isoaspartate(D-aspartate) O-methyltransferase